MSDLRVHVLPIINFLVAGKNNSIP